MASDTRNVKLGVCLVTFDGTDLGYTKGGVEVAVSTETHKVEVDQFGKTAINESIMGRACSVKVPLAETTVENLVATMPGSTLITDALKKRVDVVMAVGTDLLTLARPLILHPQDQAVTARNDDFVLLLAGTGGGLQFAYKLEEERIFNVEFNGYPSSVSKKVFAVGDLTALALVATFDATADDVTTTGVHGMSTGQGVIFNATTFPDIAGMVFGKMYFVRVTSTTEFTLHPTALDAINNTAKILWTTNGTSVVSMAI